MPPHSHSPASIGLASTTPCVLWRGSWQSVNIGDIGHTPGAFELTKKYALGARFVLWPGVLDHGSRDFLARAYPGMEIVESNVGADNGSLAQLSATFRPMEPRLAAAWDDADIMVHGSGSGFGARAHLAAWHRGTGKPYGVFGVSLDPVSGFGDGLNCEGGTLDEIRRHIGMLPPAHLDAETRWTIDNASFMFLRDTLTLDYLRAQGVRTPVLDFGPDSQFGMMARDDARADAYRETKKLDVKKYICVIPRLRYTPYHKLHNLPPSGIDIAREAINARTTEGDNAKLRELIVRYVRQTGGRVLACPEMTYQISLAKEVLMDPLPEDVKKHVVWRKTYWMPDEAASIYAHAAAVISCDCHSPIIALTHGTPGFYVRQPTDTCKGQMYRDLGLHDWFFEVEETSGSELWVRLENVLRDSPATRAYIDTAMSRVRERQTRMMTVLLRSAI